MRIKTRFFSLKQDEFFRLMLIDLASRWWGYVLVAIGLLIYALVSGKNAMSILAMLAIFAALIGLMVFRVWQLVKSPENASFYAPRRLEADLTALYFYTQDGRIDQVNYARITRALHRQSYFLFYVGVHFYYVPHSAFIAPEDIGALESVLRREKLLK